MESTTVPKDLQRRAEILQWNAFGFQGPTDTCPEFIIGKLPRELTEKQLIGVREISGASTVSQIDWIGYDHLTIHYSEYSKYPNVFTAMIQLGIPFTTHNKLAVHFKGGECVHYTPDIAERLCVLRHTNMMENDPVVFVCIEYLIKQHAFLHEWNWLTPEGKTFCKRLRQHFGKSAECKHPNKHDYRKWDIFHNVDFVTLQKRTGAPSEEHVDVPSEKDEITECMICMDRAPNTLVLPCEHCVVCKECSDQLKNSNDARTCVRCRRQITHVLD